MPDNEVVGTERFVNRAIIRKAVADIGRPTVPFGVCRRLFRAPRVQNRDRSGQCAGCRRFGDAIGDPAFTVSTAPAVRSAMIAAMTLHGRSALLLPQFAALTRWILTWLPISRTAPQATFAP